MYYIQTICCIDGNCKHPNIRWNIVVPVRVNRALEKFPICRYGLLPAF